jgi:hypothetical protein
MKPIALAGLLAAVLAAPAPGFAHSFQLGVIVSMSGSGSASGQQALDGLRLATRERDGHPDETSDGHLGGLDSHLRPIDSLAAVDPAWLRRQVGEMRLDIVTAVVPARDLPALAAALDDAATVFCPPGSGPVPPDQLDGPDAVAFVAAFQRAFGYQPSVAAARGYNAGRAVDAAVRGSGDVSDKAALARLCSGAD